MQRNSNRFILSLSQWYAHIHFRHWTRVSALQSIARATKFGIEIFMMLCLRSPIATCKGRVKHTMNPHTVRKFDCSGSGTMIFLHSLPPNPRYKREQCVWFCAWRYFVMRIQSSSVVLWFVSVYLRLVISVSAIFVNSTYIRVRDMLKTLLTHVLALVISIAIRSGAHIQWISCSSHVRRVFFDRYNSVHSQTFHTLH